MRGVFERFTEPARQVIVLAQDEARGLKHDYIGTEHLLLGLLREEEGLAARVLASLDIRIEKVRAHVGLIVGQGDEVTIGQIPFTPRAKRVLELALREALALGHNYIGSEHVLLGVTRENDGVAVQILGDLGVDAATVRGRLLDALAGQPPTELPPRRRRRARTWEYLVAPVGSLDDEGPLPALGLEGWELVAIVGEPGDLRAVLKRPA